MAIPTVAIVDELIIMVLVLVWSAILVINCFRLLVYFLLFISYGYGNDSFEYSIN
jgi:hypothetical protein